MEEKKIANSPDLINIEGTTKILEQMKRNICKIYNGNGTGFFCYIPYKNRKLKVLMTNYHVINKHFLNENDIIVLGINDEKEFKKISLRDGDDRKIYINENYDLTIIEIKDEDKLNDYNFLELDNYLFEKNSESIYSSNSIYILQYPNFEKTCVGYGVLKTIDNNNIKHLCCTEKGSSGSPILNLKTYKVIGIHKNHSEKYNCGTFLKIPIEQLNTNNEMISFKQFKKNYYYDIYFTDKGNGKENNLNNNENNYFYFNNDINYNKNAYNENIIELLKFIPEEELKANLNPNYFEDMKKMN